MNMLDNCTSTLNSSVCSGLRLAIFLYLALLNNSAHMLLVASQPFLEAAPYDWPLMSGSGCMRTCCFHIRSLTDATLFFCLRLGSVRYRLRLAPRPTASAPVGWRTCCCKVAAFISGPPI